MIGFDRSALVAHPTCGTGSQNVNRVVVRFMTKVFWSILSKIRTRQAETLIFRIITKPNDNKRPCEGASGCQKPDRKGGHRALRVSRKGLPFRFALPNGRASDTFCDSIRAVGLA